SVPLELKELFMVRIEAAIPLEGHQVRLRFSDGTQRTVDLQPYLRGRVFDPIREDAMLFRSVRVDHELGTIVWENGADIDPDVLYHNREPAWMAQEQQMA